MTEENNLREELRVFEEHRTTWLLSHRGDFVAIVGTKVIGFYPDFTSGFKVGLSAAGLGRNFLLKQVWAEDPVYSIFLLVCP